MLGRTAVFRVIHLLLATDDFSLVFDRMNIRRLWWISLPIFIGATDIWHLRPPILAGTVTPTDVFLCDLVCGRAQGHVVCYVDSGRFCCLYFG